MRPAPDLRIADLRIVVLRIAACAIAAFVFAASIAAADSVEAFYKGLNMPLIIGYSAGGGYDVYARMLARYLGSHIPGNPTIVPQQMEGAGSLRSANYIFSAAPKNGSVIGTFSRSMGISPLLDKAGFDSRKFTWLGSITDDNTVCLTWNSSPIKTWADFISKPSKFGGEGPGADPDIWAQAYKNVLGAKDQLVSGYPGTNDIVLAMQRGEVDGLCGISWSTINAAHSDWMPNHLVNILVQAPISREDGIPGVPHAADLAVGPEQQQILRVLMASQGMARPFVAPPDIPADRKAALMAAFDATMTDPDFLADARKLSLDVRPVTGTAIEKILADVYTTPKDVLAKTIKAIANE
jgi:tripartite-type tricarboxylate transporter receptor subunit TctC